MAREFFKNLPNTTTPLTAPRMNALLDGDEAMGNIIVDSINTKNKFGGFYYQRTNAGVTFTYNGDGTIKVNGTSTDTAYSMTLADYPIYIRLEAGTYTVSGGTNKIYINVIDADNEFNYATTSTTFEKTFTLSSAKNVIVRLRADGSTTYNNETLNIQLEKGSSKTTFTEYQNLSGYLKGHTANGDYIKYDDGVLICWNRIVVPSVPITTAEGSLYMSDNITPFPDYPIQFADYPSFSIDAISDDNARTFWVVKSQGDSLAKVRGIRLFAPTSKTLANGKLSYIAIGRWK